MLRKLTDCAGVWCMVEQLTVAALEEWVVSAAPGSAIIYAEGPSLVGADRAVVEAVRDLYDAGEVVLAQFVIGRAGTPHRAFAYLAYRTLTPRPAGEHGFLAQLDEEATSNGEAARARVERYLTRQARLRAAVPNDAEIAELLGLSAGFVRGVVLALVADGVMHFHVGEGRVRRPLLRADELRAPLRINQTGGV